MDTYNITLTFDNKKYNCLESWCEEHVININEYIRKQFKNYLLILSRETHKIKDNKITKQSGFCHYHCQIIVDKTNKNNGIINNMFKYFNRVYGNTKINKNIEYRDLITIYRNAGLTSDLDLKYDTYLDYILKEVKENSSKFNALYIGFTEACHRYVDNNGCIKINKENKFNAFKFKDKILEYNYKIIEDAYGENL